MLLFIGKYSTIIVLFSCFNTSHVTLYHKTIWRESYGNSFQYISCYSLSISGIRAESPGSVSIHLMLLFIILGKYSTKEKTSFNTSHVTLYLKQIRHVQHEHDVSIHLMLLFIYGKDHICSDIPDVSIHLMLLFITIPAIPPRW